MLIMMMLGFCLQAHADEKIIYSTDFQNWEAEYPIVPAREVRKTTTDGQKLSFYLNNVTADPNGIDDNKLTNPIISIGFLRAEKEENKVEANYAYVETSVLKSVTSVYFLQAATGTSGGRGWGLMYKAEGDTEWTTVYNTPISTATGEEHTLSINKENVKLRFYNLSVGNYIFMTKLEIKGNVEPVSQAKVSYYDVDGTTLIGEQTLTTEDGASGSCPKLNYQYGAQHVSTAPGYVFRGWFDGTDDSAHKVAEGTELLKDISLYAKATPKEEATSGTEYTYDMTKSNWYQEDHELIQITNGQYYSRHGWWIKKKGSIKLQVAQKSQISITLCKNKGGTITIKDASGKQLASYGKPTVDNTTETFLYEGSKPTTITFTMGADAYIHNVSMLNYIPIQATFKFNSDKIEGTCPSKIRGNAKNEVTMPGNTLFYREGWTFEGWTDGTHVYEAGKTYVLDSDVTLTPKMVENNLDITDTDSPLEVTWQFDHTKAPAFSYSNSKVEALYTVDTQVEGEKKDVMLRIDTSAGGRLDNTDQRINALSNGAEGALVNDNTVFTVPAVYGMTVKIEASQKVDAMYGNTQTLFGTGTQDSKISLSEEDAASTEQSISEDKKTLTLLYKGSSTSLPITLKKASNNAKSYGFLKGITVIYPVLPSVIGSNTIENSDATLFPNEKAENAGKATFSSANAYPNTGKRYKTGDVVTISANPGYGYKVTGYRVKGSSTLLPTKDVTDATTGETLLAAEYTVTDNKTTTLEVIYEHQTLHKIIVQASDITLGTVTMSPIYPNFYQEVYETQEEEKKEVLKQLESWFVEGTEVTLSAQAIEGCVVDYWTEADATDKVSTSNSYIFKVGKQDQTFIVHLKQGEIGSVTFDLTQVHVAGTTVADEHEGALSKQLDDITHAKSFTIPTNYTFFKDVDDQDAMTDNSYTLQYWIDKEDNDNRYEIGGTYSFKKTQITLTPVFKYNPTTRTNRINNPVVRYDFGSKAYDYYDPTNKQQRKVCAPLVNIGSNEKFFWTAQAYFEVLENGVVSSHIRDVAMWVNTGSKGYIRNTDLGDWCAFGPGTTFWCTASVGTKVSILSYSKITSTTIDGVVPTLDEERTAEERKKMGNDHIFVYSHTTDNSAIRLPIVIGDDYTYYQWIEVSMKAANLVNLHAQVDNDQHGKVDKIESLSTFGATELEDGGYAFRQGDRLKVTYERLFGYEFDKITDAEMMDADGNPRVLLKMNTDGSVDMVDENYQMHNVPQNGDGTWGTASGENKTVFTLKATKPTEEAARNGQRTVYEMEYDITTHRKIQLVFKEKPTYYITYSPGKQASGIAPVAQWVEAGDYFTIPRNQTLYYAGNTLDHWVDGEYDDSMSDEEKEKHTYQIGKEYVATANDIRLTPIFEANSFNILDIKKEETATWNFAKADGAPTINYEKAAGILVTQLYEGDQKIDLRIDLDAQVRKSGTGKFNNEGSDDRIQINQLSIINFPSTPDCVAKMTVTSNDPSTAIVAGKKMGDEGYTLATDKKSISVICSGDSAYQAVEFTAGVYGKSFAVTYHPQTIAKASLETLTCGDTTLSADDIKQQMDEKGYISFSVAPWENEKETLPALSGTATEEGTVQATTATVLSPEATVTIRTKSAITTATYPVRYEFIQPTDYPKLMEIVVNGKRYQETENIINNVKQSGSLTLKFNRTMAATTLKSDDGKIEATAEAGKELTFTYWDLSAGETVNLHVTPEQGYLKDIYGQTCQQPLSLTLHVVEEQNQYQHQAFDFVVGEDGDIDEAIAAANQNTKTEDERFYIFVPDGEYQLTGNDPVAALGNKNNGLTTITKSNVSLIGQSKEGTMIWNEPANEGISYTGTIHIGKKVTDFYSQDLTLENRFDYWASTGGAGRAVAFWDQGNRSVMKNVSMVSYQDTYYSNNANADFRGYFEDCDIYGLVDFLCGDGNIWLEKCNLILRDRSGNNICAPSQGAIQKWGYVFNNCTIKPESENPQQLKGKDWTLARPWNDSPAVTYINTTMLTQPRDVGWQKMSTDLVLRLHEYRSMDSEGVLLSLGTRSLAACSPGIGSDDCVLSAAQAAEYTLRNVMGGTDGFEPNELCKQIDATSTASERTEDADQKHILWDDNLMLDDNILEWNKQAEALCYVIFKRNNNGKWIYQANTADNSINLVTYGSGYYCVRAANQRGGLGAATKAILFTITDPYELEIKQVGDLMEDGKPYGWSTICLPFNAKCPEGIEVYAATAHRSNTEATTSEKDKQSKEDKQSDGDRQSDGEDMLNNAEKINDYQMTLTTVSIIDSLKGYVVYGPVGKYYFTPTSRSCEQETILTGNPTDQPISTTNNSGYVLANKSWGLGFYKFNGSTYAPYRAWLPQEMVSDIIQETLSSGARAIRFIFADGTTAIQLPKRGENAEKEIYYNLSGQRILSPITPGIYIQKGKGKRVRE